jgi:hypothetical protein
MGSFRDIDVAVLLIDHRLKACLPFVARDRKLNQIQAPG